MMVLGGCDPPPSAQEGDRKTNLVCFNDFRIFHEKDKAFKFKKLQIKPILEKHHVWEKGEIYDFNLNEKYKIIHSTSMNSAYALDLKKFPNALSDSIQILDKKYSLSQIFKAEFTRNSTNIYDIYELLLKNKQYLLIQFYTTIYNNRRISDVSNLLIKIDGDSVAQITTLPHPTLPISPYYLGDFNNDGSIDFVNYGGALSEKTDTIFTYTLKNNQFIKTSKFVIFSKKIINNMIDLRIDGSKSRWYHPLNQKHSNSDSCCCFPKFEPKGVSQYPLR